MNKSERIDIISKDERNKPGPGEYHSPHKTIGSDSKSVFILQSLIYFLVFNEGKARR
jgi:hypothetical protein